jgi:indolepyruvate ferredoxin oxidoreductase alpha subunit
MEELLSGNEAIARGAYESGIHVATAYPGTPSTEILENISRYKEIYCEWSTNEKVALEVAGGASFAGARVLVAMKHVGLNVAADPLFSLSYIGSTGGFVIVTADDPGMHSSQNEQDNRHYGRAAKMPVLEPSDSQEAKDFVKIAIEISEKYDTPVLLRITTRIAHSKSKVTILDREEIPLKEYKKDFKKRVILPAHARLRHVAVEKRLHDIKEFADSFEHNRIEEGAGDFGIIASGISYQYAKEAFPDAPILKIALSYPLPEKMIRDFTGRYKKIYIVEENDPFIENQIKAMGIDNIHGKDIIPAILELNQYIVQSSISKEEKDIPFKADLNIPPRPPALCPGCPHTSIFYALSKYKCIVTGDIGCYTLGALPPLNAMDTCVDMGASITNAFGMEIALKKQNDDRKIVAVIGDSTFFHSGITGLIDMIYNKSKGTVIVLDNRITAMTGHQHNPGTGKTLMGEDTEEINIEALVKSLGVKNVSVINNYNLKETLNVIKREIDRDELSVIIATKPCALLKNNPKLGLYVVDEDKCTGCKMCIQLGCPAISFIDNKSVIEPTMCFGCSVCAQICPTDAISIKGE